MTPPVPLDRRIVTLVPEVNKELRTELRSVLQTLRGAENPIGVLLAMSRLGLHLVTEILERAGHQRPSDNFYDCIALASRGDHEKKIKGL
ncbi:MAG: hypothetical protein L0Y56_06310, partial [Nitrospira sp.]|nr:hypothetical protein [Nitrospira sp.]